MCRMLRASFVRWTRVRAVSRCVTGASSRTERGYFQPVGNALVTDTYSIGNKVFLGFSVCSA